MPKNQHEFQVTLSNNGKIIATRRIYVNEYNDAIVYSLRLNKLMTEMCELVKEALKENDIERIWGMVEKGRI